MLLFRHKCAHVTRDHTLVYQIGHWFDSWNDHYGFCKMSYSHLQNGLLLMSLADSACYVRICTMWISLLISGIAWVTIPYFCEMFPFHRRWFLCFLWKKIYKFRSVFHWSLFPMVQLTIFQLWLKQWIGSGQVTSYYVNQLWYSLLRRVCVTRPQWVNYVCVLCMCQELSMVKNTCIV